MLSQVRCFLDKIKTDNPTCVNIEQNDDDDEENEDQKEEFDVSDGKKKIQLDLLLFEQNDNEDSSSEEDSEDEWIH